MQEALTTLASCSAPSLNQTGHSVVSINGTSKKGWEYLQGVRARRVSVR